jgi:hypothetical protein
MIKQKSIIEALLDPSVFPEKPREVVLAQTQMSLVFLTGKTAYKVKRPVNLGYLDYTTLEKRKHFCYQELMLNRRLCPEVYIGVVPITLNNGKYTIDGEGEIIEYAVKMLQLPPDKMMDHLLQNKKLSREMVVRVANKLAVFHKCADTNEEISKYGTIDIISINTEENFSQTKLYVGTAISEDTYKAITGFTRSYLKNNKPLFDSRIAQSKIRDCHGDLHAAHVCFINGICIYDCIEFNDRFRYGDVASEVAFLAMDIDKLDRPDLSELFVKAYIAASKDKGTNRLLNFYKCYRAYVRGKVECFKFDNSNISDDEKTQCLQSATKYFKLAESYISKID